MPINWIVVFNRLFEIINVQGETYYGGTRYLSTIREVNYSVPDYITYINQRNAQNKSTSRKDYYFDILMAQPESERVQIVKNILSTIEHLEPVKSSAIKQLLIQTSQVQGPQAVIPTTLWNADRLTEYLEKMDTSIDEGNYEHTLTLAYTCLEGYYKSFIKEKIPTQIGMNELLPMSVEIRKYIKAQLDANGIGYPDQVLNLISTVTNSICNARNNFSDSHSGNKAEKWLAVYLRDNVNAIVKLLMNFI
jgi:hypothetical protein